LLADRCVTLTYSSDGGATFQLPASVQYMPQGKICFHPTGLDWTKWGTHVTHPIAFCSATIPAGQRGT